MEHTSTETSEDRADIKTRWKKGQSGNPQGRPRLRGAGLTLTALARTLMERPVEGMDGERHTRMTEYMIDVVRYADAGDRQCRMFLLKAVERGDRRRENAQRNAKKAKSEVLRKFEEAKADEISTPMPPLSPETEEEQTAKVNPTGPPRRRPGHRQAIRQGAKALFGRAKCLILRGILEAKNFRGKVRRRITRARCIDRR